MLPGNLELHEVQEREWEAKVDAEGAANARALRYNGEDYDANLISMIWEVIQNYMIFRNFSSANQTPSAVHAHHFAVTCVFVFLFKL